MYTNIVEQSSFLLIRVAKEHGEKGHILAGCSELHMIDY